MAVLMVLTHAPPTRQLALALWTTGVVPSQFRLVGPKAWPGARDAILGAKDRIVYALSGGKHLHDVASPSYVGGYTHLHWAGCHSLLPMW
jgi:hypothetical protein